MLHIRRLSQHVLSGPESSLSTVYLDVEYYNHKRITLRTSLWKNSARPLPRVNHSSSSSLIKFNAITRKVEIL